MEFFTKRIDRIHGKPILILSLAEVAQLVEHGPEKAGVGSSTLPLSTICRIASLPLLKRGRLVSYERSPVPIHDFAAAMARILRHIPAPAKIVSALSGGMDSVVLLHLLAEWRGSADAGIPIVAAE